MKPTFKSSQFASNQGRMQMKTSEKKSSQFASDNIADTNLNENKSNVRTWDCLKQPVMHFRQKI